MMDNLYPLHSFSRVQNEIIISSSGYFITVCHATSHICHITKGVNNSEKRKNVGGALAIFINIKDDNIRYLLNIPVKLISKQDAAWSLIP